jgi:hypothetical protein
MRDSGGLARLVVQNHQLVCFQSQAGERADVVIRELDLNTRRTRTEQTQNRCRTNSEQKQSNVRYTLKTGERPKFPSFQFLHRYVRTDLEFA